MTCERCGGEHFKVISNVKRTASGDMREIRCVYCSQIYDSLEVITHAVKRTSNTSTRETIDAFRERIQNGSEQSITDLRLKLFDNDL